MSKKTLLIIIVVVIILGFGAYSFFIKKESPNFSSEEAVMGTVVKDVSESGVVKISGEINLGFRNGGAIEKIYVKVGDEVVKDQPLAKLDTRQLQIQLREAQASLGVAQANLEKIMAGASAEEIRVSEASVQNAKVSLANAQQTLKDAENEAKTDLDSAYENAVDILDDAYAKTYNAFNAITTIAKTYFNYNDQEGLKVRAAKSAIEEAMKQMESLINTAKNSSNRADIDVALSSTKELLKSVGDSLKIVRDATESINYRDSVSSTDKTSVDTQRTNVSTVLTSVINAQQTVAATKDTNATDVNTAKASVATTESQLAKSEEELVLKKAPPRQEDKNLYEAKVTEANAKVSLLAVQLNDATITSPNSGQVVNIKEKESEVVQAAQPIMVFLPSAPFQVEVQIYEEDIVDVGVGNPVKITLAAFPDKELKGAVAAIDPAENLIDGVVYYKVTIGFENGTENIKPGMTADIVIETSRKENVLVISKAALIQKNGSFAVKILGPNGPQEKEIIIGLIGTNDLVEVMSGLKAGDMVVIGK